MKKDKYELNWFWRVTTKWYFLPLLYIVLSSLAFLILTSFAENLKDEVNIHSYLLVLLFFIPLGFAILGVLPLSLLIPNSNFGAVLGGIIAFSFVTIFYIGFGISALFIHLYKTKKNIIFKKLIIFDLVVLFLSLLFGFIAFAIGVV